MRESAKDHPIEILVAPSGGEIQDAVVSARVFWQLTGLEVRSARSQPVQRCG
jgi:hypothetical protein